MNITAAQLNAATAALQRILTFEYPADAVLSRYFREHHQLGARDRAFVAEAAFGVLRRKRFLDHLTGGGTPRALVLAWLARAEGRSARELAPLLKRDEGEWLGRLRAQPIEPESLAEQAELPDWLVERLLPGMDREELLALGRSLQQPAALDLRVNTVRTTRDAVLQALAADGIAGVPTPYSPIGIRLEAKPALERHPLFKNGDVEVQDEGSQLLGFLVAPTRHDLVVDFCAGAGGKSLMLGAMMHSQGRLYAFDVSERRLARLKPRLKRSGLSNLHPQRIRDENDTRVKRLAGKIARVLVDAPCSGLGTLRRNPDLKWRQSAQSVAELAAKQASILQAAASLVRPGGRLVYATCSLLTDENDAIVDAFRTKTAGFAELDCAEILRSARIPLDTGRRFRLLPHRHGTDGFFAAALVRSSIENR
jgi:16S rRNA (cytosine967-C5)-methyltransferase